MLTSYSTTGHNQILVGKCKLSNSQDESANRIKPDSIISIMLATGNENRKQVEMKLFGQKAIISIAMTHMNHQYYEITDKTASAFQDRGKPQLIATSKNLSISTFFF